MNIGIICEYNPFHNGHLKQIKKIKEQFGNDSSIICVMSGNYVQRGEPAIFDKYSRASDAVNNGADVVLELIPPFSFGCAEHFSKAAVSILDRLKIIDYLCFGSESGDINKLIEYASNSLKSAFDIKKEKSYAESLQEQYEFKFPGSFFPKKPNDILACEYIKALISSRSEIKPITFKRGDDFSAHIVRNNILNGVSTKSEAPDEYVQRIYFDYCRFNDAIFLDQIKSTNEKSYCMDNGLAGRIKKNLSKSKNYNEMIALNVCKKYTKSNIKRAVLSNYLGITSSMLNAAPGYTNLLSFSDKGQKILHNVNTNDITIVTKPSAVKTITDKITADQFYTASKADSLYAAIMYNEASYFLKKSPVLSF